MCDRENLAVWAKAGVSRRGFAALGLASAGMACAPMDQGPSAGGAMVREQAVTFAGPTGTIDGEFFHPGEGRHPGVILWPDIAGIRPAKRAMARRLAEAGHAVLLANPYYRDVAGQQFADFADFAGNGGWTKVTPWRSRFTVDTIKADQSACAAWLLQQSAVDTARGIGTQGYCMTGSFAIVGPAGHQAIRAGASFHGGGLVRTDGASPHQMLRKDARYLVAIARDDDAKAPGEKDQLRLAARSVGADAEVEVYAGDHGWCVPDSPAYASAEAERAWTRLLALYARL